MRGLGRPRSSARRYPGCPRRCACSGALSSAAAYFLRASGLIANLRERAFYLLRGVELVLLDQQVSVAATFQAQVDACPDGARRSLVLGPLAWSRGDAATAEEHLSAAAASANQDEHDVMASALVQLAMVFFTAGDGDRTVDMATQALGLGPLDSELEQRAWSALALGEGMRAGAPAGLDCLIERLPEPPEQVSAGDAGLLTTRGTLRFYVSHTAAAIADLRTAARMSREATAVPAQPRTHIHLAQLLLAKGDWDEAIIQARVGLSLVENEAHLWIEAQAHAALGTVLASRGEWDSATGHTVYVQRLHQLIDTGPLKDLTTRQYEQLRDALQAAEQTGLSPHHFSQSFIPYLEPAYRASDRGYAAAFVAVTIIALAGMVLTAILVKRPNTTANRADEAARSELTG